MLSLPVAMELYLLLEPYLPEVEEGQSSAEYIQNIMGNMSSIEGADAYMDSLKLLGSNPESDSLSLLSDFIVGLSENEIVSLQYFAKKIGL